MANLKDDSSFDEELKEIQAVRNRSIRIFILMAVVLVMTVIGFNYLSVDERLAFGVPAIWSEWFVFYLIFYRGKKVNKPICPRCKKYFFAKEDSWKFFTSRPNVFANKCLNCGLELIKRK